MVRKLQQYYESTGIAALRFACAHRLRCAAESPRFTSAKEAYVGPEYEAGTLPRLLFLSLDSGSADADPNAKTLEANREWMRITTPTSFPKGRHWHETHELACCLLRPFKPDLSVDTVGPFFAHTNSAKCCLNNPGHAVASETLFRNCRQFIADEIRILCPAILVTQGDYARDAVTGAFEVEDQFGESAGSPLCKATILRLLPTLRTIWFHTYHPSAYGLYWRQKNSDWSFFATTARDFVRGGPVAAATRPTGPIQTGTVPVDRPPLRTPVVSLPTPVIRPTPSSGGDAHDAVVGAFATVFGIAGRPFGTPHGRSQGVSDNAEGVQWNAGVDREQGSSWLGVNLEGMAYDNWPIARLIEHELTRPRFPELCRGLPERASLVMSWTRDAWQAAARLPITEIQIGKTPITLDRLTEARWCEILREAYDCLDSSRGHRGRALQTVTLKAGPAKKYVSPHLHIQRVLWSGRDPAADDAAETLRRALTIMQPVYDFVRGHQ